MVTVTWLQARVTRAIDALEVGDYELALGILLDLLADVEQAGGRT